LLAVSTLALAVAACSDTAGTPDTTQPADAGGDLVATATTEGNDTTAPETTDPGEESTETTDTTSDRPLAPDFTLELGDGSSFTLSEGEKPVYLVFWAEW